MEYFQGSEYEALRQKNIDENKKVLEEMGLIAARDAIRPKKAPKPLKRRHLTPNRDQTQLRRSDRISQKPPSHQPLSEEYLRMEESMSLKRRKMNPNDYVSITASRQFIKEEYTEEHLKLLGTCKVPWSHVNFEKEVKVKFCLVLVHSSHKSTYSSLLQVYDPIHGTTCHQCRQKTKDKKTVCSKCKGSTLRGQFCGTCLQLRYGENLDEVLMLDNWICPPCRGICNCSFCRTQKGLLPTGVMAPDALGSGFPSVAHYLIHTYQKKKDETSDETKKSEDGNNASSSLAQSGSEDQRDKGDVAHENGSSKPVSGQPKDDSKDEQDSEDEPKYRLEDFKPGDIIACRNAEGKDPFWLAKVISTDRKHDEVRVGWFERAKGKNKYYYAEQRDWIPRGSIFYKGVILKHDKKSNIYTLMEDLRKYDCD